MLEPMAEFFDRRLTEYDAHQRECIPYAKEFYPYTASLLPRESGSRILDLGCGTGLELEEYYRLHPDGDVTAVDLAPGMLAALAKKFPGKSITLIQGSYFNVPLGTARFDAVVCVETLHHFTIDQKITLYRKAHEALKAGGYLILTDYFSSNEETEREGFLKLARLQEGLPSGDPGFYHYDTPLTIPHETEALAAGGFRRIEVLNRWADTGTLRAFR